MRIVTSCAASVAPTLVAFVSPRLTESETPMSTLPRPHRILRSLRDHGAADRGAATAEYAIATMAAVAFAGLLVVIMQSDEVRGILTDMVRSALTFGG
jgi:hypothetical protein